MCICNVYKSSNSDCGHQGDAPQHDHGGLQQPLGRQVRRHAERQGAEEDPADANQFVELDLSESQRWLRANSGTTKSDKCS